MPRMTSKGQVTIPKRLRDQLGLTAGSEIEFEADAEGNVRLKSNAQREPSRFAALRGRGGFALTSDELMKLTRGWGEADREDK
jgi:antitoxin PrlF